MQEQSKQKYAAMFQETVGSLQARTPYHMVETGVFLRKNVRVRTAIDIIGDYQCTFTLVGDEVLFYELANAIHGITLTEDILASFIGEYWNMVMAPVLKSVKEPGVEVDITPSVPAERFEGNMVSDWARHFLVKGKEGITVGEMAVYAHYQKGETT